METAVPMPQPSFAVRYAGPIRLGAIVLIVLSLFLLMAKLPVKEMMAAMEGWITGLGVWGPAAFVVIYIAATIALIPGSALTLAAGAIFGLLEGTVVVSVASTTGAAMSFLIGRYLARDKVAGWVRAYPKFGAIDKAIGEGGWKIVAMLRLSPAVPFNLQNYLYGLTAIRFWTCVLTSWVAMLPGTFMYVYLGYIARQSVDTAAGSEGSKSLGEWVLLGVGLAATVVVSVYITRIAQRALKQHTQIEADAEPQKEAEKQVENARPPWGWVLLAALLVSATVYAQIKPDAISGAIVGLFGPPKVTLTETYGASADSPAFDHSAFDVLLKRYVEEGWVDYKNLSEEAGTLDAYIAKLADAPIEELGRDERLALLINAYNAFTLRLILDYDPTDSIKDIPSSKRWDAVRWSIGGNTYSLNQIEHELIRPNFKEPRIHFALVCAAIGCPILRSEAYTADQLEAQLEDQARYIHTHDRWLKWDQENRTVHLTALYKWYGDDFEQVAGSVTAYAAQYVPQLKAALDAGEHVKLKYLNYDWSLNSRENAP